MPIPVFLGEFEQFVLLAILQVARELRDDVPVHALRERLQALPAGASREGHCTGHSTGWKRKVGSSGMSTLRTCPSVVVTRAADSR
ncbi:MAG: hypothetical protein LJF06_08560 [Gemmatimonadetes bacterium]|nr:hypothetical protein [Gemmatimonadota bacterium]